ncbi:pre-mRNA-processing protein 45 [[Candida] jaroonii]|uniref:Pre-mRNA-processing protein 45 n=1 Tax=[Candida] jaroonii TaxID=467808 RepID=A0ACA9Y5A2_9ASCO|nr:pre-mRNA-processing protein 45 [[Candida] jaroonii]
MFSSLLSKPKHSVYTKSIQLDTKKNTNSKVIVVPNTSKQTQTIDNQSTKTISKYYLNDDGTLNYNLTISSANNDRKFHSSYDDTIPLKKKFPNLKHSFPKYHLTNSSDDSVKTCIEDTKAIINKILQEKMGNGEEVDEDVIKYETNNVEERGRERTIQIKQKSIDPMLPPKHKLRKNKRQETSPPPPILKTSDVKATKEDQDKWKIPSLVSNWKNDKGFIISLDKRVMTTNKPDASINIEKLSNLSSALDQADKQAREDIKSRNEERKKLADDQQRQKDLKLQELAELSNKRKYHGDDRYNKRRRE